MREPVSGSAPAESTPRDSTAAWWAFVLLACALLPTLLWLSSDFGVTWDEKARHRYGELVWEFLRGLRSRSTFETDGGHLYGGLFDTICAAVEPYVPLNRYVLRHGINAVFGWIGILYSGRLAARLFGRWAGVMAMVLLAASPRYFADSMNNPKDLPLAAMTMVALYYISTVEPRWPYMAWPTAAKIAVSLALALNIRAAALMYLGYLGLLVLALAVSERHTSWSRLADTAGRLAAVTVAVLLLGTATWPWAQGAPLIRPIEALLGLASFPHASSMLFAGRVESSVRLPWNYVPWWFLISTPPVVLVGAALAAVPGERPRSIRRHALWIVLFLPLVLVVVRQSTLYDGVRHLLFVYPILVVLAASGWSATLSAKRPWVSWTAAGLFAAGLMNVLAFHVRSHPNQAVYFNELVGGPRGAFARYDMDYWGNCVLEAVAWSAKTARLSGVPIVVSGDPWALVQLDAERFRELAFAPPHRGQHALDIRLARGSAKGVTGLATRSDALYRVQTAGGAVLCVVVPGPRFSQLQPRLALPGQTPGE